MPILTTQSQGVFVISVTPFDENGDIDWASLDRVTDNYLEAGATGLTILGMMGEAPKMTQDESIKIARHVITRVGDIPVVVGVSSPGLAALSELSMASMDLGAAGVMVAPPGSLRTDQQIISYYTQVAETLGAEVPFVLQDFPLATGVQVSDAALAKIIDTLPSMVMLKHEDWPGLAKISRIRSAEAKGQRHISILCGNGGGFLVEEMARGADGAMTGFGYPEMMVKIIDLMRKGKAENARDLFDAYLPLIRYESQPGLGLSVRKYVLMKRGAIASAALRKPGSALDRNAAGEVDILMDRLDRRLKELG